jgi:putative FmdB family regulatory protein
MPIYEYRCTNGHTFDARQSMSDDPLTVCEVCGAPVQRVLHAPAVQFKGSGFYNTDYGTRNRQREKAAASSSSESSSSSGGDSGSSSSSESKPAADKPASDKPKSEKAASKS